MIFGVLRHLLESTIFAAILLTLVACLCRGSAGTRHALLLCAAFKFALPLQWLFALGAWLRRIMPAPDLVLIPSERMPSVIPAVHITPRPGGLLTWFALGVWLGVALLLLLLWSRKLRVKVTITTASSEVAVMALHRMRVRLGMARSVDLKTIPEDTEPCLYGLWNATVVLPETLPERLTTGEFEAVILHELAHARRRDNLTRALVHLLSCAFWFYPLLWWLERRIAAECELACDEIVLSSGVSRHEYLRGILKICQSYVLEPIAGSSNVSGSNLKQRLEGIMSSRVTSTSYRCRGFMSSLLLGSLAMAAMLTGFSTMTSGQTQAIPRNSSKKSPVSCLHASVAYPQGTVLQVGKGPQQMCVQNSLNGDALWVMTSDEARERSRAVVSLTEPAPYICKQPTAPIGDYCTCEETVRFSKNATVQSNRGVLTCGVGGKWLGHEKQ